MFLNFTDQPFRQAISMLMISNGPRNLKILEASNFCILSFNTCLPNNYNVRTLVISVNDVCFFKLIELHVKSWMGDGYDCLLSAEKSDLCSSNARNSLDPPMSCRYYILSQSNETYLQVMFDCDSMIHRLGAKEVYERERGCSCNQSSEQQWINDTPNERRSGREGPNLEKIEKRAGRTPPSLLADES